MMNVRNTEITNKYKVIFKDIFLYLGFCVNVENICKVKFIRLILFKVGVGGLEEKSKE